MRLQAVLFDLDGTIADTNGLILQSMAATLARETGRPWSPAELLPHWGMRLTEQLQRCHPDIDLAQAIPFYRRIYAELQPTLLAEFPGVRAMLAALRETGYRLGVVTSKKRENARQTLAQIAYTDFFEILVAEEDTPRHKPAPDPLHFAAARLGLPPAAAAYVGDNPDDLHAAHAAGMLPIGVDWCLRPTDELRAARPAGVIAVPEELPGLLQAYHAVANGA